MTVKSTLRTNGCVNVLYYGLMLIKFFRVLLSAARVAQVLFDIRKTFLSSDYEREKWNCNCAIGVRDRNPRHYFCVSDPIIDPRCPSISRNPCKYPESSCRGHNHNLIIASATDAISHINPRYRTKEQSACFLKGLINYRRYWLIRLQILRARLLLENLVLLSRVNDILMSDSGCQILLRRDLFIWV